MSPILLNKLNFRDLYIYNLGDEILGDSETDSQNKLSPLFFDVNAQVVNPPKNYKFGEQQENDESAFDLQEVKDSVPTSETVSAPTIIHPGLRPRAAPVSNPVEQEDENLSDEPYSENESDDGLDLYKRDERSATYSTQYLSTLSTSYEDNRVSFLNNTRSAYIYFNSPIFAINPDSMNRKDQQNISCLGILKAVFDSKNREINNPVETLHKWKRRFIEVAENKIKIKQNLDKNTKKDQTAANKKIAEANVNEIEDDISAIFMIGGGHFAAAIISHTPKLIKKVIYQKESESILPQTVHLIAQKSVHRYTTRRKQGGSQSAMDNAKGKANSAGSSLRRYNEQMLAKDVKDTVQSWSEYLPKCKSIFIKANTAANFKLIVSGEDHCQKNSNKEFVLYKNDPRIKRIPVNSKKITITELKYVWVDLSYLSIIKLPKIDNKSKLLKEKQELLANSKQSNKKGQDKIKEEEPLESRQTNEIIQLLKKQRAPALMSYLRKQNLSATDFRLQPTEKYQKLPTLLHYATDNNLAHMVYILLNNLKVDPTSANKFGETPFDLLKKHVDLTTDIRNNEDAVFKSTIRSYQKARFNLGEQFCNWENDAHVAVTPLSDLQIKALQEQEDEEQMQELQNIVKHELQLIKDEEELKLKQKNSSGKRLDNTATGNLSSQIVKSLSDDDRKRFEREQRARAAEARFKKMTGK